MDNDMLVKIWDKLQEMDGELKELKYGQQKIELTLERHNNELVRLNNELNRQSNEINGIKGEIAGMKGDIQSIKNRLVVIENEHGAKLNAILDGYLAHIAIIGELRGEFGPIKQRLEKHDMLFSYYRREDKLKLEDLRQAHAEMLEMQKEQPA